MDINISINAVYGICITWVTIMALKYIVTRNNK
jgi:hypothetical protein